MPDSETLSHTKWDCKYHVVFIPKYRRKALYHELRRHLGEVFRSLAEQKECRIEEGHLMADHVHMLDRKSTRLKLQSPCNLVCRLLLEKKKKKSNTNTR